MRVYQFRHSGKSNLELWNLDWGVVFLLMYPGGNPKSKIHNVTVTPPGLEPGTHGLKVRCSTS